MATTQTQTGPTSIEDLQATFAAQKAAFLAEPNPSAETRRERVLAVAAMTMDSRLAIREAIASDFGSHPPLFADMVETLGMAGRAAFAAEHLEEWMAPEPREADPGMYGTGYAEMRREPKGVIGNIVPWNFPFDLSLGPLVDMLAAGNRVIIKPSEFAPACGELLAEMIHSTFDPDLVEVALGGLDLAQEFTDMRWDHLLYTGSPRVGREVAKVAAGNLVPVTLELGGKTPAIILEDAIDERTAEHIVGIKMIKNGQMCNTVDHCLVPREQVDRFVELAERWVAGAVPDYSKTEDCPGIISDAHLDRVLGLIEEARDAGCRVIQLDKEGGVDRETRRVPMHIVVDPPAGIGIADEEVFGPILPVHSYGSLDEAIAKVNDGERPLGLYVFSNDQEAADDVLARTSSGGACVNACALQGALPSLGFGGVGMSGSGRHHGIDGFHEFTNPRGVFVRGEDDQCALFYPPFDERQQALVDGALEG
ncbi:MAG: coniferyl-aldehyde dehydrogenase [Solirubrobacterales bacterium]|jgi:coniferyl-aldehyde dehydrogenase|nr:coniferyl-aldehyde dehydrogenase [Solirubrobacterales bacterium]